MKCAPYKPEKLGANRATGSTRTRPNVVLFVGLQGSGKTTTLMKYAHHYKMKGFKPALVC